MRIVYKFCVFFVYSLHFVFGDVAMDLRYIKECNSTSPVSLTILNRVLINKKLSGSETSNFKCFLHCLFTKYTWMDDEGGFLLHEMKRVLDETELDAVTIEYVLFVCTAMNSVDKCQRAFLFVECFWKKTYQGTVTAINVKLCSFVLDNNFVINMPHFALHKKQQRLPKIGEEICIGEHYHCSELLHRYIFLCEKSLLNCKFFSSMNDHNLLDIIEKRKLSLIDLEKVYLNNRVIEELIAGLRELSTEDIVISLLEISQDLFFPKKEQKIDLCFESMLPTFSLRTISDCRYVDKTNEKYVNFPYWTFGVHGKQTSTDILIGYFYLSKRTGIPFFKDVKHRMPCCVVTKTNHDFLKLNDRFILIKNYRVFTEVFSKNGIVPLEYLMFSICDVIVLNILPEMNCRFCLNRPNTIMFIYNFKFILQGKSNVIWSSNNTPECWLKLLIFHNSGNKHMFLALNSNYAGIITFFKIGEAYEIFHCEKLLPYFSKEMQRLENRSCHLLSEKTAIFVSSTLTEDEQLSLLTILPDSSEEKFIFTVEEAQDVIKTSSKLLSFQGIIHAKEFADPIESRTATSSVPVGFGTLGRKTHLVHFLSDSKTILALYLNNWERLQLPLGLVPGMRVLVRNVIPQKNVYLKSTVLTTFTVLGYEPKIEFCSMNLCEKFYGQRRISGLHCCGMIPNRVLFSVHICKISIHTMRITCKCRMCSKIMPCDCQDSDVDLTLALTFLAVDHSGEALIKSDCFSVLKSILDLKTGQWNKFLKAIEILGGFDYGSGCSWKQKLVLHEAVHHTIAVAMAFSLRNLDLHCFNTEQKSDLPILNCIDTF